MFRLDVEAIGEVPDRQFDGDQADEAPEKLRQPHLIHQIDASPMSAL